MAENRTYYYARVSTKDQNLDRQLSAFYNLGAKEQEIIQDKASGKDINRTGYLYLKNNLLRNGDTLVIKSLDRLSRSKMDIKNELQWFKDHSIHLKIIDLPTTMININPGQEWVIDMVNNLLIEVLSSIAEQERATLLQRQREGIDAARAKGKHMGRPILPYPGNWDDVYKRWKSKEIKAKDAVKATGLKQSSFYKLVHRYEDEQKTRNRQ